MRRIRLVVIYYSGAGNATLSYQHGWPLQLARSPRFAVHGINLARRSQRVALRFAPRGLFGRADAVVLLHSVFSNECALPPHLAERVARVQLPKALFLGNEYKLLPEKLALAEALEISLLISQLSSKAAHELYRERLGCAVVGIPNAGFDPDVFAPFTPRSQRPVDLGYRAFPSPLYLGHDERTELAEHVEVAAKRHGLVTDISLSPADRFDERGWAGFLNRCRAQIGSEAGGDYFDLTDETRLRVTAFCEENPDASLDDVRRRYFAGTVSRVSGRALSGRIAEAAATKTVQLLLEGEYGGYFLPNEHYIPLRKDFTDVDEAVERLRDEAECARLADAAYEVARGALTYDRLLARLYDALLPLVSA